MALWENIHMVNDLKLIPNDYYYRQGLILFSTENIGRKISVLF
jgi:hypothetical protein